MEKDQTDDVRRRELAEQLEAVSEEVTKRLIHALVEMDDVDLSTGATLKIMTRVASHIATASLEHEHGEEWIIEKIMKDEASRAGSLALKMLQVKYGGLEGVTILLLTIHAFLVNQEVAEMLSAEKAKAKEVKAQASSPESQASKA